MILVVIVRTIYCQSLKTLDTSNVSCSSLPLKELLTNESPRRLEIKANNKKKWWRDTLPPLTSPILPETFYPAWDNYKYWQSLKGMHISF